MSRDVYQAVTDRITAALEAGVVPWHKPWDTEVSMPRSLDGRPYRGINVLLLGMSEYSDPRWGTYNAVKRYGGNVRKGGHGELVVLWKPIDVKDPDAPKGERQVLMLRHFVVFNVEQCDGLGLDPVDPFEPIAGADAVYELYNDHPSLSYGGGRAFYRPSADHVQLSPRDAFETVEQFYLTLFHELAHSTGHQSRLNRAELTDSNGFGSQPYSREELTAEFASATLAARVGIEPDYDQSASYIASWLAALHNDKKLIVGAAARAQKAVDWILRTESGGES